MSRERFILAVFTVLFAGGLLSCNKSYRQEEEQPQAIEFRTEPSVSVSAQTRVSISTWSGQDVWVYGVERDRKKGTLDVAEIFIDRVKARTTDPFRIYIPGTTSKMYFYEDRKYYDFFGYYTDGAPLYLPGTSTPATDPSDSQTAGRTPAAAVSSANSTVSYDVVIDGTQDIMVAYADRDKDIAGTDWTADKSYSAYSSRHGVTPCLRFHHQLTRFVIDICTPYPDSDPRAGKMTVTNARIETCTRARLDVVRPGAVAGAISPYGAKSLLPLYVYDGMTESLKPFATPIHPFYANPPTVPAQNLGEIMLMPGEDTYNVNLTVTLSDATGISPVDVVVPVKFPEGEKAQPGYQHRVLLKVWGPEKVDAEVSLTPWTPSGNFELDPDKN